MNLNTVYIGAGLALILALVTALVGPLLVDWTAYRSAFEERAEAILGHPVQVLGTADAQILPNPSLTFTDVRVGDPDDPLMTVDRFAVRLELFPLLSGEVQIVDMTMERPSIALRVAEDGRFEWLSTRSDGDAPFSRVVLERLSIVDGAVSIEDARSGRTHDISGINAVVDARSLEGPYRLDGSAVIDGTPASIAIATGERQPGGDIRIRTEVFPATYPLQLVLDGMVGEAEGRPRFEGTAIIARILDADAKDSQAPVPWTATSAVVLDADRLLAREIDYSYGPPDRPLRVTGAATVHLSPEPRFEAVLRSRQLDLDRLFGAGPNAPADVAGVTADLINGFVAARRPPIPGRVGFDIPGIVVGGAVVQDIRFDLQSLASGWQIDGFSARLPGSSTVSANGRLSADAAFLGNVAVQSEQPAALAEWAGLARVAGLPALVLRSGIVASAAGVSLTDMEGRLGADPFTGHVILDRVDEGAPARLSLDLSADTLDLEQAQTLAGLLPPSESGSADITLALSAGRVTYGPLAAGGVDVLASYGNDRLGLERLRIADLAGSTVDASGEVSALSTTPDGQITAELTADSFEGIAAALDVLTPAAGMGAALRQAAPALLPARLSATLNAALVPAGTALTVQLSGEAGGGTVTSDLAFTGRIDGWRAAEIDAHVDLAGLEAARVLESLGLDRGAETGPANAQLRLSGRAQDGLAVAADLSLGTTSLGLDGTVTLPLRGAAVSQLVWQVVSEDAGPFVAAAAGLLPDAMPRLPAELAGSVLNRAGVADATLAGTVADLAVQGDLSLDLNRPRPRVAGSLATGPLGLAALAEAALGPGSLSGAAQEGSEEEGTLWPATPFGPSPLAGIDVAVDLQAAALALGPWILDDASMTLRSSAGGVGVEGVSGSLLGGQAEGSIRFGVPTDAGTSVTLDLAVTEANLEELVWPPGRAVASGTFDLSANMSGTGRSVAGMVASLAGEGAFVLRGATLRGIGPGAFDAVIRAADAGLSLEPAEVEAAFAGQLDAGSLDVPEVEGTFSILAGTLRAGNVSFGTAAADVVGTAVVDLSRATVDATLSLTADASDGSATGAVPQAGIIFSGPLAAPERRLDVTPLVGFLNARAFEAELRRVEELQSEILERERLLHLLSRQGEEAAARQRAAELEVRQADVEARLAAERAEEARRAAEAAAVLEEQRLSAEEAMRAELQRLEAEEAARQEAARQEAARQEAERLAAEEAARLEAERLMETPDETAPEGTLLDDTIPQERSPEPVPGQGQAPLVPPEPDLVLPPRRQVESAPELAAPDALQIAPPADALTAPDTSGGISGGTLPGVY